MGFLLCETAGRKPIAFSHVSGAAALAWGAHRYASNVTIRRLLAWRADNLGVPGRGVEYGFGQMDAEQVAAEMAVPPAIPGIP
jgi:subtilisin